MPVCYVKQALYYSNSKSLLLDKNLKLGCGVDEWWCMLMVIQKN
jgi:hypothetical protein